MTPPTKPASFSSAAASSGSSPRSASLDRTSVQFTTLIAAPSAIACRTTDAPSSSVRCARRAEASRTAAGPSESARATVPTTLSLLQFFCSDLGATICDQLTDQALTWRYVREYATGALYCRSTFDDGFVFFGGMGDSPMVPLSFEDYRASGPVLSLFLALDLSVGHNPMIRIVCDGLF